MIVTITIGTVIGLAIIYAEPQPLFKDGDIIFRTNLSAQALATMAATDSKYTSIGVIKNTPQGLAVIDTSRKGQKVILIEKWITRGLANRFAVYRYRKLEPRRQIEVINSLYRHRTWPYDYFLNFSNQQFYGSEMVYMAYRESGADIGETQKIRSLNLENPFVRNLLHIRLPYDPECKNKTKEQCMRIILNRDIITPVAIANDLNLELIYSNYPF